MIGGTCRSSPTHARTSTSATSCRRPRRTSCGAGRSDHESATYTLSPSTSRVRGPCLTTFQTQSEIGGQAQSGMVAGPWRSDTLPLLPRRPFRCTPNSPCHGDSRTRAHSSSRVRRCPLTHLTVRRRVCSASQSVGVRLCVFDRLSTLCQGAENQGRRVRRASRSSVCQVVSRMSPPGR